MVESRFEPGMSGSQAVLESGLVATIYQGPTIYYDGISESNLLTPGQFINQDSQKSGPCSDSGHLVHFMVEVAKAG